MVLFRTVEIDLVLPSAVRSDSSPAHGTRPHGALTRQAASLEAVETLRFSDLGYVTPDHVPYPPIVTQAFDLDRGLSLSSSALGGSSSYGAITLINADGALDDVITQKVNDHLPVRIFGGEKRWDDARGLWIDPPSSDLMPIFGGLGTVWQPDRNALSIPLLDVSSWLSVNMDVRTYGGGGKLDGDSNVAGRNQPRVRGTVCNISPLLIDAANYVYQVSDGPATITALYEGGFSGGIGYGGDVADLYAASPAPGTYTLQRSPTGTWLRLGTKPVYGITVDVFGSFASGAAPKNVLDILRQMLVEDFAFPAGYFDPSWSTTSDLAPWAGGWFWDGSETVTGADVVNTLLSGLGISLIPTRSGTMRPVALAPPVYGTQPVLVLTHDQITEISSVSLDSSLNPPTWRWRIGSQHNFTIQTSGSGLHPQAPTDRQALIAISDRNSVWFSAVVKARWRVPNDPSPVTTALQSAYDAQLIAERHGDLWGSFRELWAVSVPAALAWQVDLGDFVSVQAPVPGLSEATMGCVVAEHIRSSDATVTLQILILGNPQNPADQTNDFGGDLEDMVPA
ncbi:hypothetical protein [Gluconobacter wancherniae]|uniref:hypothetical protein n=1 Tax=Gluconobacter wancherniae TaxID=1307955 RepID=UPI001B8D69BC|nr:hypothetical protein [Gluconobacter wancherniae]MBS1088361.1 hypothetical protein [Gluconobacter wancherniae]